MTVDEAKRIVFERYPDARIIDDEDSVGFGYYVEANGGILSETFWEPKNTAIPKAWLSAASRIKEGEGK